MNAEQKPRRERAENAAKRRRQIIEATIASVVDHGLSGTTLATVAQAAGLSQGVAVFYFKTKDMLLAETLRWHYEEYRATWRAALETAGADPVDRIKALVAADFEPGICNRRTLAFWHSCWGEAKARPLIAAISAGYDGERNDQMERECARALPLASPIFTTETLTSAIDCLTDGLWLNLHLSPEDFAAAEARQVAMSALAALFPSRAADILDPGRPT